MNTTGTTQGGVNQQIVLEAAQWFVANGQGTLAHADAVAFMQWLRTSPQHVAEYLELAAIAAYAPGALQRDPSAVEELVAQAARDNVFEVEPGRFAAMPTAHAPHRTTPQGLRHRGWRIAVAASLAITTVGSTLVWWIHRAEEQSFSTAHGQQREWTLPDGSALRLNSESTVTIRFDARTRRADVVHGQALFDIATEAGRPFEVHAGPHLVEDIGTRFDVHRQGAETTVTVVEGRVHVWDAARRALRESGSDLQPLLDLRAGEQARITLSGIVAERARVDERTATAWTREEIVFEDERLADVVAEFNRYARRPIRISEQELGEVLISGTFGIHEEATFRAFLDTLPGIQTDVDADGILVRRRATTGN